MKVGNDVKRNETGCKKAEVHLRNAEQSKAEPSLKDQKKLVKKALESISYKVVS